MNAIHCLRQDGDLWQIQIRQGHINPIVQIIQGQQEIIKADPAKSQQSAHGPTMGRGHQKCPQIIQQIYLGFAQGLRKRGDDVIGFRVFVHQHGFKL